MSTVEKIVPCYMHDELAYKLSDQIEWRTQEPDCYDLHGKDIQIIECINNDTDFSASTDKRNRTTVGIPVYQDPDYNAMMNTLLHRALEDAYDFQNISAQTFKSEEIRYQQWLKTKEWKKPATPRKKKQDLTEQRQREATILSWVQESIDNCLHKLRSRKSPIQTDRSLKDSLIIKTSFNPTRYRSNGGVKTRKSDIPPWISLALHRFLNKIDEEAYTFNEYKRIAQSPTIGDYTGSCRQVVDVLVRHEMAHVAQYFAVYHTSKVKLHGVDVRALKKPHGLGWQTVYRYLRHNMA